MQKIIKKFKEDGTIALILVIMVTTLTVVSSVALSLVNINNLLANYILSEKNIIEVDIDSCFNEALWQIASSTSITGGFDLEYNNLSCYYQISTARDNIKTVTSTASTTSDFGSWTRGVVGKVDISQEPFTINSYKDIITGSSR
tara:strand:- start:325 stop:756 length:432 start_codon:yes stop_codon:yes gene_type:complete